MPERWQVYNHDVRAAMLSHVASAQAVYSLISTCIDGLRMAVVSR